MATRPDNIQEQSGSIPDAVTTEEFVWRGKRRGRPPGSKNSYQVVRTAEAAAATVPEDVRLPDLTDMIGEQLRIIQRFQRAVSKNTRLRDVVDLSRALEAAVRAVERAAASQDEILARMSQAQVIEAAIRRLEASDTATVAMAIRRLREHVERGAAPPRTAVDAIADL